MLRCKDIKIPTNPNGFAGRKTTLYYLMPKTYGKYMK